MVYIAGMVRQTGALEYAAAAYNAGEDRIAAWKAERNYEEIPELVESIPFTETREYVQVVLRNTAVYRMIYGSASAATQASTGHARGRGALYFYVSSWGRSSPARTPLPTPTYSFGQVQWQLPTS